VEEKKCQDAVMRVFDVRDEELDKLERTSIETTIPEDKLDVYSHLI